MKNQLVSQPTQCNPNPRINKLLSVGCETKIKTSVKKKYVYVGKWEKRKVEERRRNV